ncbi:MAG: hypothetical protein EON91_00470 [Brevundimonas sp.]|uniref:hypothetical protein n=1 Tax=Brevundimonas sp. TaxID=1871086 RepID=UPI00121BC982|nr:hypothetical protein [Brevundimonas sp.]RZJ19551.1 MAG: hypothetical protein EON91_00470 [Brevundimonas sp.]
MDEYESPVVEQGVWTRHANGDVTYYPPGGAPPGPDYVAPDDERGDDAPLTNEDFVARDRWAEDRWPKDRWQGHDAHFREREPARGGHRRASDATWARAREDYLAGDSAEMVCARYDLREGTLRHRAKVERWRRSDQPDPEPVDLDAEIEAGLPDYGQMARHALVRMNRAVLRGRATEAASWMRLHQRLLALATQSADQADKDAQAAEKAADKADEQRLDHLNRLAKNIGDLARDAAATDVDDPRQRRLIDLRLEKIQQFHAVLFPDAPPPVSDKSDDSDPVFSGDKSPSPLGGEGDLRSKADEGAAGPTPDI